MKKQTGKISHAFFNQIIREKCGYERPEVSTGPGFGTDVSVVNLPDGQAMALASDPLSLIPSLGLRESAWLSVHLTANDIATTGHAPMYGQFVLNLPAQLSPTDFKNYWEHIHQYCKASGIAVTGGHTGFIEGQNSTIAGGATMVTIAGQDLLLTSKRAKSGDSILVTKSCAISSSAILAMSFPETVKRKAGLEHYQKACDSFYTTSVLKDALLATDGENHNGVTAMHDVTEGGVLGAIYEMAVASNNGAFIYADRLPVNETQRRVCEVFSLSPPTCIGAGSMIITCNMEDASNIIATLEANDIPCAEVGKMTGKNRGIKIMDEGRVSEITYQEKDPYWEAFFKALKAGWK